MAKKSKGDVDNKSLMVDSNLEDSELCSRTNLQSANETKTKDCESPSKRPRIDQESTQNQP